MYIVLNKCDNCEHNQICSKKDIRRKIERQIELNVLVDKDIEVSVHCRHYIGESDSPFTTKRSMENEH